MSESDFVVENPNGWWYVVLGDTQITLGKRMKCNICIYQHGVNQQNNLWNVLIRDKKYD